MPSPSKIAAIASMFSLIIGVGAGLWLSPDLPEYAAAHATTPAVKATPNRAAPNQSDGAQPVATPGDPAEASTEEAPDAGGQADRFSGFARELLAFSAADPVELADAWRESEALAGYRRQLTRAMIVSEWMKKDPGGALNFLRSHATSRGDQQAIVIAYSIYAEQDLEAAQRSIESWSDPTKRRWAREGMVEYLAATNPMRALDYWSALSPNERPKGLATLRNAYAVDPQSTLATIRAMPANQAQRTYLELIGAVAKDNPEAALQLALSNEGGNQQHQVFQLLNHLSYIDLDQAIDMHGRLPPNLQGGSNFQRIVHSLASRDMDSAMRLMEAHPEFQQEAQQAIVSVMSQNDPEAAWKYVQTLEPSQQWNSMVQNVYNAMSQQDLDQARTMLDEIPDSQLRVQLENRYVATLAKQDPQAALDYAFETGNEQIERQAMQTVIQNMANEDPELALKFALDNRDVAPQHTLNHTLNHWFKKDPEASLNWLQTMDDPDMRKTLSAGLVSNNAYQDPDLSAKLLDDLAISGDMRGNISQNITRGYARIDADKAIGFALQQDDASTQLSCLNIALQQYKQSNPEKALSVINNLDLEAHAKTQLMAQLFPEEGD